LEQKTRSTLLERVIGILINQDFVDFLLPWVANFTDGTFPIENNLTIRLEMTLKNLMNVQEHKRRAEEILNTLKQNNKIFLST
jgi:hypothetical protein